MSEGLTTRRSLAKTQRKMITEQFGNNLKANWCFNKWWEKVGFFIILFLGVWKLLNLFGLFL